jgi:hypothetical protein
VINEQEALQNAATRIGLTIKEWYFEDKRKTGKKYYAIDSKGISVSPVLAYEHLNMFLLGWVKGGENNKSHI